MREAPTVRQEAEMHPAITSALASSLAATCAASGFAPPHSAAGSAADPLADPWMPVLAPLLEATGEAAPVAVRGLKLFERVARSAAASRLLHTKRLADALPVAPERGVTLRPLYRALGTRPLRPGEPEAATLVELAPGAIWAGPATASQREWLVLGGTVHIGPTRLEPHDYHVLPAGHRAGALHTATGALLYQREAPGAPAGSAGEMVQAHTQRASQAHWEDFGPGIKRRLMWQHQGLAAMLYHALPGAAVPHHGHGHDEECLMLAGDFFLDEVLLRPLDYQVAPAGTEHVAASTDTGLLVFAHGDLALDIKG